MAAADGVARDLRVSSLPRDEVLRYMGVRDGALPDDLAARVDAGMRRCLEVARPRGVTRAFRVAGTGVDEATGLPVVTLEGCALRLVGNDVAAHLAGAREVGLLAVTLGIGVERELRALSHTDQLGELVMDAAGTTAVERAADAAEADLVAYAASRGLYTNFRYSPGYGDLPLDCQPTLLAALDAQRRLGLTLTRTDLLVPTKSVTALVGMFETRQPSTHRGCGSCACREFCTVRRTGRTCHA
ncbi:vitamin B12 dependent methionine synthase [bacterium]|nr:vitamin B12 dependent methionine synthase [bacterium]